VVPSAQVQVSLPMFSDRLLACLKVPGEGDDMKLVEDAELGLHCRQTGKVYPLIDGVPSLFKPIEGEGRDLTSQVKSFYEEHPFPSYEGLEEFGELVNKGSHNSFAPHLLKAIGYNKTVKANLTPNIQIPTLDIKLDTKHNSKHNTNHSNYYTRH